MNILYRLTGGAAVAMAAIGLAGCGGGSSPHVASLGHAQTAASSGSTTTLPKGNPTQLLDEWATCMRSHGDPGQADPTIDANGVIHITYPPSATPGDGAAKGSDGGPGSGPCGAYLTAASTALRGGQQIRPDPAKLEKYSRCMRANGIADFPDPTNGGLQVRMHPGSDLDPRSPAFQAASKKCAAQTGVPGLGGGTPPRGAIEATGGSGPVGGPPGAGRSSGNVGIATGGA